jgi:hypothetical protein
MHIPRLNERARKFGAPTTFGNKYLADYRGNQPFSKGFL